VKKRVAVTASGGIVFVAGAMITMWEYSAKSQVVAAADGSAVAADEPGSVEREYHRRFGRRRRE